MTDEKGNVLTRLLLFLYVCNMQQKINSQEDSLLYASIRSGDEKAFDTFFLKYYPILCAYAHQFVDFEDGQEIVQDIMVWFWENREMQVFDTSLRSYLFKAVKNRCLTLIHHNEIKKRISDSWHEHMQNVYEDPDFYIVEELTQKIETAISHLPDTYRDAFERNRFQCMTYQEIAQSMNISPKTVDYRIQQALKMLRTELKDYLPLLLFLLK